MPEVYMRIQWSDDTTDRVYSPSSVIRDFFEEDEEMSVDAFEERITDALSRASERVREVYGMECASAKQELRRLQSATDERADDERVTILNV
ncbi:MAG: MSMEG_0570 family nitrogen starvation response protein [Bacteroidetes bacterium SW_9_63_38]|nr:MAG: MSMEG_0570 family nitrogen starvation response protein [Bacteroidetes bacterium SW_9_63_38]